jgi:hypothetical protein
MTSGDERGDGEEDTTAGSAFDFFPTLTTESGDCESKARFVPTPSSSVMATAAIIAMRSCSGGGGEEKGVPF